MLLLAPISEDAASLQKSTLRCHKVVLLKTGHKRTCAITCGSFRCKKAVFFFHKLMCKHNAFKELLRTSRNTGFFMGNCAGMLSVIFCHALITCYCAVVADMLTSIDAMPCREQHLVL